MKKIIKDWLINKIRSLLCEHDFKVLYLDNKFRMENGFMVHSWVCRCKKCGKISYVDSKKIEL